MTRAQERDDIRLHVETALGDGASIEATPQQAHYLRNVMRLGEGDTVALFNGADGEWLASVVPDGRRGARLQILRQTRPQEADSDLWLLFAPVKRNAIDFIVQKATELGIAKLQPVLTENTDVTRVNLDRMHVTAIEAAEQSRRLTVPEVGAPLPLASLLDRWSADRRLMFCDEIRTGAPMASTFGDEPGTGPWAILIGPEGGFTEGERRRIADLDGVVPVHLGPRILRAETAAVAAIACWQAMCGDWR